MLFNSGYKWHNPSAKVPEMSLPFDNNGRFRIGDTVFVKPAAIRCTTRWPTGRVTAILSEQAIEVEFRSATKSGKVGQTTNWNKHHGGYSKKNSRIFLN